MAANGMEVDEELEKEQQRDHGEKIKFRSIVHKTIVSAMSFLPRDADLLDDIRAAKHSDECDMVVGDDSRKRIADVRFKLVDRFSQLVHRQIDEIITDDEIEEKVDKLQRHIIDSERKNQMNGGENIKQWRPTGIPADDVIAHLQPVLVDYRCKLTTSVNKLKEDVRLARERLIDTEKRCAEMATMMVGNN